MDTNTATKAIAGLGAHSAEKMGRAMVEAYGIDCLEEAYGTRDIALIGATARAYGDIDEDGNLT